jgi:hypothetical protein
MHPEEDFADRVVSLWWKRKEKARKAAKAWLSFLFA